MRYIVSDIHGCYEQYLALLEKMHFSEADELYNFLEGGRIILKDIIRRTIFSW